MLSSLCSLWDTGDPVYTCTSVFIIFLIIWQVKRSFHGLRFKSKRSCCRRHRKVRQRARDAASRARRLSQEEAEKPWELLSVLKRQSWLPKEGNVRELLCADPCCGICNTSVLEIQQLLECENRQISTIFPELPQDSSCLEMSMSSVSCEQHLEHCSRHSIDISLISVTPTGTQLSEHRTQSTSAIRVTEHCADHLEEEQEFQLADMVPETVVSSRLEELMIPENKPKMTQSKPNLVQENQDHHRSKSCISLLSLNSEITNLTRTMGLQLESVLPAYLPFPSPRVRRLLEVHVKKWIHFQKWGLPRRVEESLRQFMPDPTLFCRSRQKQLSSILNNISNVTTGKIRIIPYQTRSSYLAGQPTQTCWVSEWSVIDLDQRNHCHQIQNLKALTLTSQEVEPLRGFCPLSGRQANDSESRLQKKYSQLFCGLPSLHSESLVATLLGSHKLSKNMSKLSLQDPHLLEELSLNPLLPQTPPKSSSPSSPSSPPGQSPHERQGSQISVPFLTLAECEELEWHIIHRQLRLQWGLPAVFPGSQHTQSHMQYEACDKFQPPRTVENLWSAKPFSVLNRKLFFPEPARRLLEFHLQRQLIHLRWGLPQRIQQSIHLFLSSTDQQPLSWSSTALPTVSIPQPGELEADGTGGLFSPTEGQMSIPMPHLFAQAKARLQSHVDTKCEQIHQGKVPAYVRSSWDRRSPRGLEVAPLPYIPQDQPLELQAATDHDLHHRVMSWVPMAPDQDQQALSGAVIEHCKGPHALPEETIEKLETTLRHKYLTFLSGLPALYVVPLSRATSPAANSKSGITEMVREPIQIPQKPVTQMRALEDPCEKLGPCVQDDSKAHTDTEEELQPEVQEEGMTEEVPVENQTHPACPHSFNAHMLDEPNFHLRKNLATQLKIPEREREFKKSTVAEKKDTQESLGSVSNQEGTVLQKLPIPPDTLPALDSKWVHFKGQLINELKAVYQRQKQASSKAVSDGFAHWASKQISRDMNEAQVQCVQVEPSENNLNLENPWLPEPQGSGKSKYSAQDPTLAEKSEDPAKPKVAGDLGEGDAGLGLYSTSEKRPPAGDLKPEGTLPNRTPHSSWQRKHSFYLVPPCPHSPQQTPELKFPETPPGTINETEHDMQDCQPKLNVILEPARIPEGALPVVPQASQSHPFLGHPIQGKPLQRPVMPNTLHKRPSLPESTWRNKIKAFLHSVNSKVRGKRDVEPMFSTAGKVAQTRKQNVEKGPAPAKSLTEKTKTEKPRGPKDDSANTKKPLGPAFLTDPQSPNNKIGRSSQQRGSASVPGYPRHCPRHCPQMACGTQLKSPP